MSPAAHPPVLCAAGEGVAAAGAGAAACPRVYRRHSVADIEGGEVPYLFGGPQRPCCRNCLNYELDENGHSWPGFCRFESHGELCLPYLRASIVRGFLRRGFTGPLTLSPCDLWPLIAGRSLWFFGDSQTLDLFKVSGGGMKSLWADLMPVWQAGCLAPRSCRLHCFRGAARTAARARQAGRRPAGVRAAASPRAVHAAQAAICFFTEFWDGRQKAVGVTEPAVLEVLSAKLEPFCVELPGGTRICYARVDSVGGLVWSRPSGVGLSGALAAPVGGRVRGGRGGILLLRGGPLLPDVARGVSAGPCVSLISYSRY